MTAYSAPDPNASGAELLGELLNLVRNTESAARTAQRDARRSEKNRVGMLYIHSLAALTIAPLFATASLTSPAFAVMREVPGAPYSPAILLGVGGLVLGMSAAGAHRVMAFTGLGLLGVWYALMALNFTSSAAVWILDQEPTSLTHALDMLTGSAPNRPSIYAIPLYIHFAAVMVRHMITLKAKSQKTQTRTRAPDTYAVDPEALES